MNDPRADRQVEQALTAWMHDAAPSQAPGTLLEDTFAQTMKSGQARAYPWQRLTLGGRSFGLAGSPVAAALVVLGLVLVVAFALVLAGGVLNVLPSPGPSSSARPNPSSSRIPTPTIGARSTLLPATSTTITAETSIPVPDLLGWEIDGAQLWGLIPGSIDQIDLATGTITGSVPIGLATNLWNGFGMNDAGLWATEWESATLYHVDPVSLKVVAAIPAGKGPKGILANADGVWVADTHDGKVLRIDPATNKVVATIVVGPTGSSGPNWLASGLGSVWVDIPNNGTVVRIDPVTDLIQATIPTVKNFVACGGLAIGTDAAWVSGCDSSAAVARFDPTTNTPVTAVAMSGHGGPTLIGDVPWVSLDTGDESSGLLIRINPATNTIDRVLVPDVPFGGGGGIAVVADSVWVHDYYHGVLLRFPLAAFGP
jgi:YVTN family beta-propeller protein